MTTELNKIFLDNKLCQLWLYSTDRAACCLKTFYWVSQVDMAICWLYWLVGDKKYQDGEGTPVLFWNPSEVHD